MNGTDCVYTSHSLSRSYLNHLVLEMTSNTEEKPSVRTENRRPDGSKNRSKGDGEEENRMQL
jgi:hypothetical protein